MDASGTWTLDTDLFFHDWPDSDAGTYDTATVVRQYAGSPPDHAFEGGMNERPSVQVMCRSKVPSTAEANIEAAFTLLDGAAFTQGKTVYLMQARQSPFYLGKDDNGRLLFAVNFQTVTSR
jgi:hypothetical protein